MVTKPLRKDEPKVRRRFAHRVGRFLGRFATDPGYRSVFLLRLQRPRNLFQPANRTGTFRYPELFRFAQDALQGTARPRILSFGCATGEEVFSLRATFPGAMITGVDINPSNIRICRQRLRRNPDPQIDFRRAASADDEPAAAFDVVFCLSVLRHGGLRASGTTRCDHLIKFADFEQTVAGLARCLKPGGLLFIVNSNFRLADTILADDFEAVLDKPEPGFDHRTPIFGPDNILLPQTGYDPCGFRKK